MSEKNVISLFNQDAPVDKGMAVSEILTELAKETRMTDVVVIGLDSEGDIRIVTSPMDARTAYFMTGVAGQYVLNE